MTHFSIRHWTRNLLTILALLPTAGALGAGWNEAVDGDLSGDYQNPTVISLVPGVNTIRATSGAAATIDLEYFRLDLPAQAQIDAIYLRDFVTASDSTAFIGVQAGTSFTFPADDAFANIGALLGWTHFGLYEGDGVGGNILPMMGANFGAIGFSGPLTGPSYTFWSQQQGQPITYELEFVVSGGVPEPTTALATISAIVLCGLTRRRQG
jgi:hypothetical protein